MKQIRQGDVLFEKINAFPKGIKEKNKTIALGEATRHSHRFESENVLVFEDSNKQQFVDIREDSEIIHEEHENILIPKGKWKVVLQQEYDLTDGVRNVLD